MARDDTNVGVIILCGEGDKAFCSGGDQRIRGSDGYIGDDDLGRSPCWEAERAGSADSDS